MPGFVNWKKLRLFVTGIILVSGGMFLQAYLAGFSAPSEHEFRDFINKSFEHQFDKYLPELDYQFLWSFTHSCYLLGGILASITFPKIGDYFGRKLGT